MKRIHFALLGLALCLLLAACGKEAANGPEPSAPPEEPIMEDERDVSTLIIALSEEVVGLDVQQIAWENMVHDLLFEPLVVYSADLSELYPAFAESFTATDEYLEFVLPADARFSNGDRLDAAALKASMDRFFAISEYASDLEPVTGVEIIDTRTVRYHLSEPAPYVWANIASLYGGIVDVAVAEQLGDFEFNRKPVGNGMYYVEDWKEGSQLTLKRNPYFHTNNPMLKNHEAPPFETVIVRFIADGDMRLKELAVGNVDIIYNAPTARLMELELNKEYDIFSYMQPGVSYLNLQTGKGPLKDIRLRQALTYAVDREEIRDRLGAITPTYTFLSAAQAGYSAAEDAKLAQELGFDPERAKELLTEAGWTDTDGDGVVDKDGEKLCLEMMIPSDNSTFMLAGPILQEQFAAIGVETQILALEADYIKELMREDDYTIGSRALKWIDPDILYYAFTGDSGYPWDDPEVTELILAARYKTDPAERTAAYAAMSERLAQDFKAISIFADNYIMVSNGIHGIVVTSDGRAWFSDAYKDATP